jgi:Cu-Zn family superoxide dismutase
MFYLNKMFAIVRWGDENQESMSVDNIIGCVNFYQKDIFSHVSVSVNIKGLPSGIHGFHVHEKRIEDFGEDVLECCEKLGGHFNVKEKWSLENQTGTKHGINGHNGDLCNNIFSDHEKFCETYFTDSKISLYEEDEKCIIGRSIVIHEDPDDMGLPDYLDPQKNTQKFITGNAGKRIACGNILRVTKN